MPRKAISYKGVRVVLPKGTKSGDRSKAKIDAKFSPSELKEMKGTCSIIFWSGEPIARCEGKTLKSTWSRRTSKKLCRNKKTGRLQAKRGKACPAGTVTPGAQRSKKKNRKSRKR